MKTTLNIDGTLMRRLRQEAARRDTTMTALVEAGLRLVLADTDAECWFSTPTCSSTRRTRTPSTVKPCRRWIERARRDPSPAFLTWNLCYEFLRVSTHRRESPWTPTEARRFVAGRWITGV